jgi:molybdopterin converting factor small subunit
MTIRDVFELLKNKSKNNKIIDAKNIMISINGIDSSVLGGENAVVMDGDNVTLVTIVHGG